MTNEIITYSKNIPLAKGRFTVVSYWWYTFLMQWKWYLQKGSNAYYAVCWVGVKNKRYCITMHRFILGLGKGDKKQGDHKNRDTLDNTFSNIRICSPSQNGANRKSYGKTSIFMGVSLCRHGNKMFYRACITYNKKTFCLKRFPYTIEGEINAAKSYDMKARELHGKFANLNF